MKVKELIEKLSTLDPDLYVLCHGYEGGFHFADSPKKEETLEVASNLCDKLFNKADKEVRDQFFDMKKKRPVEEVRNMCFNYARSIAE